MPTSTEMYWRARFGAFTLISAGLGLTNRQFLLPDDDREWREFAIWLRSDQLVDVPSLDQVNTARQYFGKIAGVG